MHPAWVHRIATYPVMGSVECHRFGQSPHGGLRCGIGSQFGCGAQGLNRAEIDNRTAIARLAHQRQSGSAPEKHALDIDGLNAPPQSQIALFNVRSAEQTSDTQSLLGITYPLFCMQKTTSS